VRAAPELLGAPTTGGESAPPRGGGGEIPRSHINLHEIAKNGEKTGGFVNVFASKAPKTLFFTHKYLTRYTHETFFEEYTNFEAHYLSHC
jgi:hypothetical protein